eukprot:COSAG02_NODE_2270_length_9267_cov_13.803992_1_plen_123_part_10
MLYVMTTGTTYSILLCRNGSHFQPVSSVTLRRRQPSGVSILDRTSVSLLLPGYRYRTVLYNEWGYSNTSCALEHTGTTSTVRNVQGFFRVSGFPDVRFYQAQPITKFLVSELWFGNITEKFMN